MRRILRSVPVALLVVSLSLLLSRGGETVPLHAARTGNLCGTCHFDPNGGGPRKELGFAFARNRHTLAPDSADAWASLSLTNRVGEEMPLYVGVNQRFMLLTNNAGPPDGLDRDAFFNMENAIHFAFQPHQNLTLVYSFDAFSQTSTNTVRNKEAFGMFTGLPVNGYVKAGRFRSPFGLRMDDHTVATRNSFLEFSTDPTRPDRFLPFDPRFPDMGIEIGGDWSGWFGRLAYTNGEADVFDGQFAETKAIKLGLNSPWYQGAVSFYDQFNKVPLSSGPQRATRWGYYGMTHWKSLALIGEIAAGTDEDEPVVPGFTSGPKTNRLAYFAELDYAPWHYLNLRVRYDHLEYDRASDDAVRDANTHDRIAGEAEWVPVPFAELRGTLRRITHKDETAYGFGDETQMYLQFHFSY